MHRTLNALMSWLLPPDRFPRSDELGFAHAAMLMLWAVAATSTTLAAAVVEHFGGGVAGGMLAAFGLLVLAEMFWLRRSGRVLFASHLIVSTQMLSFAVMLGLSGGRLIGLIMILPMFVFLAAILLPKRWAVAWAVYALGVIVASAWLAQVWATPPILPPETWIAQAPYRVPMFTIVLTAFAGLAFVAAYRTLFQRVEIGRVRERELTAQARAQELRIRDITENLPALIAHVDGDERVQFTNGGPVWPRQMVIGEPIGMRLREVLGEHEYERIAHHVASALRGERASFDFSVSEAGRLAHYRAHFVPDQGEDGATHGFYSVAFDTTEQKISELRANASERRMRLIADNVPVAISYIDAGQRYRFNNLMYERWFRQPLEKITGRLLRDVLGERNYTRILPSLQRALAGETVEFEVELERDGELRRQRGRYSPDVDASGRAMGVIGMVQDVTELVRLQDDLVRQAHYDALTGLANRYRLYDMLNHSLRRYLRSARPLAALYLDLDRFKSINDTWGHAAGDAVLCEFAARLLRCKRASDVAARLAGDEFVLVLEDLDDPTQAERVIERINDSMREPFSIQDREIDIGVSIGLAIAQPGDTAEELLRRADRALYADKARRRASGVVTPIGTHRA